MKQPSIAYGTKVVKLQAMGRYNFGSAKSADIASEHDPNPVP